MLLSTRNLGHGVSERTLFEGVNLNINRGDRLALAGHNGCGKSTMLALLAGREVPAVGEVQRRRGLQLALVEQFLPEQIAAGTVADAVLQALPPAQHASDGWRAEAMLSSLGFTDAQLQLQVAALSGGQENRLMLARALVAEPDLLLMDEPSNHMDVATLQWLEAYLRDTIPCAYVLVSHDRQLLDATCTRTAILRDERLYSFDLGFSAARQALADQDLAAALNRKSEEKKIAALRTSAKRLAEWGRNFDSEKFARRARNMQRRAERMEDEKTFVSAGSRLNLDLGTEGSKANRMLGLRELSIRPGGASTGPVLLDIEELVLRPGERVALLGANGVGKSSLIAHLVHHYRHNVDDRDHVAFSPQAELGYYDQELAELDADAAMADWVAKVADVSHHAAKGALIHAGFPFDVHHKTLGMLSGGERARVLFTVLALRRPNLLVLDEPTNHIDIEGREQLEEQLLGSNATVLITSHDRRFVDTVAERVLVVADGTVREEHDPDGFYQQLVAAPVPGRQPDRRSANAAGEASPAKAAEQTPSSDDLALARLLELEELLAADQERKSKHQKQQMQDQWRAEITTLNRQLGLGS